MVLPVNPFFFFQKGVTDDYPFSIPYLIASVSGLVPEANPYFER